MSENKNCSLKFIALMIQQQQHKNKRSDKKVAKSYKVVRVKLKTSEDPLGPKNIVTWKSTINKKNSKKRKKKQKNSDEKS